MQTRSATRKLEAVLPPRKPNFTINISKPKDMVVVFKQPLDVITETIQEPNLSDVCSVPDSMPDSPGYFPSQNPARQRTRARIYDAVSQTDYYDPVIHFSSAPTSPDLNLFSLENQPKTPLPSPSSSVVALSDHSDKTHNSTILEWYYSNVMDFRTLHGYSL